MRVGSAGRVLAGSSCRPNPINDSSGVRAVKAAWGNGTVSGSAAIGPNAQLAPDFLSTLRATIERYNGFAASGVDLDFHRGAAPIEPAWQGPSQGGPNRTMYPLAKTGPYHAILLGAATLDTADLSMLEEIEGRPSPTYSGTRGLAELVMLSGTEPYRTRSRARFELILHASQDPDLNATMTAYGIRFYELARDVVARWYDGHDLLATAIGLVAAIPGLVAIAGVTHPFSNRIVPTDCPDGGLVQDHRTGISKARVIPEISPRNEVEAECRNKTRVGEK